MKFTIFSVALLATLSYAVDFERVPRDVIAGELFFVKYCNWMPGRAPAAISFYTQRVASFFSREKDGKEVEVPVANYGRVGATKSCTLLAFRAPDDAGTMRLVARKKGKGGKVGKKLERSKKITVHSKEKAVNAMSGLQQRQERFDFDDEEPLVPSPPVGNVEEDDTDPRKYPPTGPRYPPQGFAPYHQQMADFGPIPPPQGRRTDE